MTDNRDSPVLSGHHSRLAIYEIMPISDAVRIFIVNRAPADTIRQTAIDEGMETMPIAGSHYVTDGETSLAELVSVLR